MFLYYFISLFLYIYIYKLLIITWRYIFIKTFISIFLFLCFYIFILLCFYFYKEIDKEEWGLSTNTAGRERSCTHSVKPQHFRYKTEIVSAKRCRVKTVGSFKGKEKPIEKIERVGKGVFSAHYELLETLLLFLQRIIATFAKCYYYF